MPDTPARLNQFLAEEVRSKAYADLLLGRAKAAREGRAAPEASGDAYWLKFGKDAVVIGHHYLKDWRALRVGTGRFCALLESWRDGLAD